MARRAASARSLGDRSLFGFTKYASSTCRRCSSVKVRAVIAMIEGYAGHAALSLDPPVRVSQSRRRWGPVVGQSPDADMDFPGLAWTAAVSQRPPKLPAQGNFPGGNREADDEARTRDPQLGKLNLAARQVVTGVAKRPILQPIRGPSGVPVSMRCASISNRSGHVLATDSGESITTGFGR
jgi:hypothetical protein